MTLTGLKTEISTFRDSLGVSLASLEEDINVVEKLTNDAIHFHRYFDQNDTNEPETYYTIDPSNISIYEFSEGGKYIVSSDFFITRVNMSIGHWTFDFKEDLPESPYLWFNILRNDTLKNNKFSLSDLLRNLHRKN